MVSRTLFRFAATMSLAAAFLAAGDAPDRPYRYNGGGYLAAGIGACQHKVTNLSFVGGGQGFLWRGLTLGADAGYYRFVERSTSGFGITNLTVGYSFARRDRPGTLEPFVNAGVLGAAFGPGFAPAGGFGGGLNYWFRPRVGLHTGLQVTGVADDVLVMFRLGVSFR